MLTNLAFLALLCSGSALSAASLKRRFEEVLPVTAMGMVCVVFLFGVFGCLKAGVVACVFLAILLYVACVVWLAWKRQINDFLLNLVTPGFVVFVIVFLGLSYYNFGKVAYIWDEFSHWVDIVKVMATLDDFGTNAASHSVFQSYPPGMSVFQYILQKLTCWLNPANPFSEWRVYVAYQVFSIIPLMPTLSRCSFRRPLHLLLCGIVILLTPLLFYANLYNSVYIDPYLGIVSGAGLLLVLTWEDKNWLYHILICLYCTMLILAKDAGMMFAVFLATAYALDTVLNKNGHSAFLSKKKLLNILGVVLSVVVPKMLWNWEIQTSGAAISFSNKVDFAVLVDVLLGRDTSYRKTVLDNYLNAQFDSAVTLGHTPITINYFALTVLFLLALYFIYHWFAKKESERKYTGMVVLSITAVQMVVYILGLCVTYMFKFTEYEATNLASMTRYLNMVFLATWLVIAGIFCYAAKQWIASRSVELCLLSAMLIVTPMKNIISFTNGSNIEAAETLRESYEELNELIHTYCDGTDAVYFISQDDAGFNYWIARFNARPNTFNPNFSWSVGETDYQNGMYARPITAEQWQQELMNEYDYVAIYTLNGYFFENYSSLFEEPAHIAVNALYEVDKESGLLSRCW